MHESLVFQRLSVELSEFGTIDSSAFSSWKNVVTAQEKQASQTLDVTQHGNTTPHSNSGGYHSNNHYNNVTPHSNSAGYHTNNLQTNYTPHVDNAGYHTNNRSYTYYPHYDSSAYHYNNRSYTYYPHVDNSAYHYNNRQYTYTPHTDDAGYHYNTRKYTYTAHGNSRYHSNSGHSNTGSHSNYWYNHTNTTPHNNSVTPHQNVYNPGYVGYHIDTHTDTPRFHTNGKGAHQDAMYSHQDTPGKHTNSRVNDPTGSHSNTAGSHSNSGGTTYTPHSNYAASHSNSGHGNYVPHSNSGDYHSNSGHGNYVPHSNGGDYHSNSGHGNYSPHSNTGASHSNTGYTQAIPHTNTATSHNNNGLHTNYVPHSNTRPHSNSAFDHQNYIPSKTHFFNVENDTLVKGTVSIGLFAFDKNNDGSGTQDTLSKTVKYTLSIRKVKNLDGSASASAWRTLLNATTQDVYDLNTVDPLSTGNTDPKATEGYYEIRAVAQNDSKTEGGVTKNYVGQEQIITVKVQQNTNPDISVVNGSEFIGFTFSEHGAMTSTGSYKSYSDKLYETAPVDKQAGLFITVNMTDPDNGNYQKAKVHLQKPDGTTVANSIVDVIWSNGSSVVQSNGVTQTGYVFIPHAIYTSLGDLDGIKVIVDLKDYYDASCTQEAGGHINRNTLSKSDSTVMLLNTDVTKPVVTDSGNPTSWVKSAILSVSATDNKVGVNRIMKPDGNWVSGNSTYYSVTQNGSYTFVIEDKAGNQTTKVVNVTRVDSEAPSITLTPSTTAPTNQDVSISADVLDTVSGVAEKKWASGIKSVDYFASNGTVLSDSFIVPNSGVYTVYARDNTGNETVKMIEILNIDKEAPDKPTFVANATAPTNKDISVTINFPADGHVKQYRLETGAWVNYTKPITFSQNGTVYARTQDIAGNWSEVSSYTVNNIDKVAPTAPRVQVLSYNVLLIDGSIDNESGLDRYMYKLNNGEWLTYSHAIELPDGQYKIVAKAVDKAGNETSATIDYLVFKSALDKALEAVVRAENSRLQADVNTARPLVAMLPNGGEKTGLQNRLAYVQGNIDKELMKQELIEIQTDIAEDKVVELPQVRTINTKVSGITMRAMALPSSVDRTDLDSHISDVQLESMATEKVIIAEQSLLQADVNTARTSVNKVTTSSIKVSLNNRLDAIQLIINGVKAVDKAKETSNQTDVDNAWDIVDKMPDGDIKDNLQDELAKIDKNLKKAIEAVEKAEARPTVRSYIIDADNKVKALRNSIPEKPGLAQRVQALKDAFNEAIKEAEYQENLRQATHYTEQAETYVTQYYIDKAQVYINALPEGDANRISLQARLDVAQGKYDTVINPKPVEASPAVKEAIKWVEYSEKYKTAVYINKAQKLVTALPDGSDKNALQARLDALN